jgi:hypothetical protein
MRRNMFQMNKILSRCYCKCNETFLLSFSDNFIKDFTLDIRRKGLKETILCPGVFQKKVEYV